MVIVLTIIHVLVCIFLVIVVLLQSGKAADLAGAFGGMGSQTAFGPRGSATVLSKATTIAATVFMITSLTLAIFATRNAGGVSSVTEQHKGAPTKTATPAGPAAAPTQPAQPGQQQPTVTVTPIGPGGAKGQSTTRPVPIPSQPGANNQAQPQPAVPPAAPANK
jgi:preprotein translocase subunit SecG